MSALGDFLESIREYTVSGLESNILSVHSKLIRINDLNEELKKNGTIKIEDFMQNEDFLMVQRILGEERKIKREINPLPEHMISKEEKNIINEKVVDLLIKRQDEIPSLLKLERDISFHDYQREVERFDDLNKTMVAWGYNPFELSDDAKESKGFIEGCIEQDIKDVLIKYQEIA